ncbi:4-(cytidine 5'-diphospho)-2-C-methyl-D-erythritol kinase [Mycetocola reblochoni]|uniref:4-diphosphocytidyl-2-C-methyl-D-erythritol kinase n=2 Tax=Mycetocola reblochoni TaxID=331618 RepID=A0A1R4JGT9_9MICO|nr:4-(cytidine 5'-diphospho)-2-C-methyl-D-erythritol kinase [Mycetocola reblochoni]RLP68238.1 4-(cytidine 5'-diphospho)-2-C-methyl-D-erythritol kinase [Mycetocola reblochoni]SJN31144.1 4-diphosphocytidyl-2-C-methyl-D-erythritol kinase [Mycetocola reblochoni REB411]
MTPSPPSRAVRASAPGKINVFLGVGAVMEDGYHEIATAYQSLAVSDTVTASPAEGFRMTAAHPASGAAVPVPAAALTLRAAKALARRGRVAEGVHLHVDKLLPVSGGLGGGSANAAAALLACHELWGLDMSREELTSLASRIGADVPFALRGGSAIGTGRGDQLSPVLATGVFHWVIVLSGEGLSTVTAYRALDEHRERHVQDIGPAQRSPVVPVEVLHAIRAGDPYQLAEAMHNDLQAPVLRMRPELTTVMERGELAGALAGMVVGSGPSLAFLVADAEHAHAVSEELRASGHEAYTVTSPSQGARLA